MGGKLWNLLLLKILIKIFILSWKNLVAKTWNCSWKKCIYQDIYTFLYIIFCRGFVIAVRVCLLKRGQFGKQTVKLQQLMIQMQDSVWWMTRPGMWCSAEINWRRLDNPSCQLRTEDTGYKWAIITVWPCVTALLTNPWQVTRARPRHHPGERTGGGTWSGADITHYSSINNYPDNYKHHEPQRDRVWCLAAGNKSECCHD